MAQYQLKVMLNTSIPEKSGYIELTSDILNYDPPDGKGKKTLVKYPFFDPYADYPRQEIQDLEYHKRLEVFFNEEKFKSMVIEYSNKKNGSTTEMKGGGREGEGEVAGRMGTRANPNESPIEEVLPETKKKKTKKTVVNPSFQPSSVSITVGKSLPVKTTTTTTTKEEEKKEDDDDDKEGDDDDVVEDDETKEQKRKAAEEEEEKKKKQQKKINNFEFTIQTILCTGFPVNNYFQSMEYYDPSIRTKSLTLKGSSWFPFLPGRFDRRFSYLKIGGGMYTVSGVVWVNDALNHPKYLPVLESYGKYNDEKNEEVIKKKQAELKDRKELEMNLFILNLYRDNLNQNSTVWRSANVNNLNRKKQTDRLSVNDILSFDIQIAFQEDVLRQLHNAPEIDDLFERLDVSFNDTKLKKKYKFSSLGEDISYNIFLMRGTLATPAVNKIPSGYAATDTDAIKSQPDKNKAYFYWKMLHENVIQYEEPDINKKKTSETDDDAIEYLTRTKTDKGIFRTDADHDVLGTPIFLAPAKYYKEIYDTYKKKQTFRNDIIKPESLKIFIDDYNLSQIYKVEKDKKNDIYWLYKTLLENYQDIKKRASVVPEKKKKTAYEEIVSLMHLFIDDENKENKEKDNLNQNVKDGLNKFLLKFSLADISKLSNVTYRSELEAFAKKMATYEIEKKTYNYVSSNADFTDDPHKKEIEGIIAEKFKHFNVFSSSLKELATTRIVSNPFWKVETDKYVGIKKGKIVLSTDKNKEDIFKELNICKETNAKCKNNKLKSDLLNTELDELKFPADKNAKSVGFQAPTVYEAYIQTNVIKGKITKENYGKLKCAYLNYSLGAMYQKMKKKTRENYIIKNKVYFDLEKEIKKAEAELKPNGKVAKKKNVMTPRNIKGKKGGRRSRKHKVVKKHGTRKRKSFVKNTKTRKYRNDYSYSS